MFAQTIRAYHETWCPAVDPLRMTRTKRAVAVREGQIPAADCHPNGPVRYLGVLMFGDGAPAAPGSAERRVHVDAYVRDDGTKVREHTRSWPGRD